MIRLRTSLCWLLVLAAAVSDVHAKRASKRVRQALPPLDCKVMADSLVRLYQADDPAYLTWDFSEAKCDSSQLYTAYYYQGIGFLFISAWKEALYFLSRARDIGGPRDEEIFYHLWIVYRHLERFQEMERLTVELHQRNSNSLFLMEILDQWKAVNSPHRNWSWAYSSKAARSSSDFLDQTLSNRVRGEIGQKAGLHRFRETGSLSLKSQWSEHLLQGFQANLGGEYEYQGLSAEANWGASYERGRIGSNPALVSDGARSFLLDSNWNFAQGRVALGYSHTTPRGWSLGWTASAYQFSPDWRVLGVSHSQTILFDNFILVAFLDLQRHWIHMAFDIEEGGTLSVFSADGVLNTASLNITPYFSWHRHSLGIGPAYYASRSKDDLTILPEGTQWQHSLTGNASYGFDLRTWCRLAFNLSYGYEFDDDRTTSRYTSEPVWGWDLGFSLSY